MIEVPSVAAATAAALLFLRPFFRVVVAVAGTTLVSPSTITSFGFVSLFLRGFLTGVGKEAFSST